MYNFNLGEMRALKSSTNRQAVDDAELDIEKVSLDENNLDNFIIQHLKEMSNGVTLDKFFIQFECIPVSEEKKVNEVLDWSLCGTDSSRKAILKESTFALILAPSNSSFLSTASIQTRLYESLRSGAIPVILGGDSVTLSFKEVIAWRRAVIFLPKVRTAQFTIIMKEQLKQSFILLDYI
jgi:alpha-1,4-N-acetylglucosaminyltransferase EXTL3